MKTNIRTALFFMFLAGFTIANTIAMATLSFPYTSLLILGILGLIFLFISYRFYKKFSKEFNYVLHPVKDRWVDKQK